MNKYPGIQCPFCRIQFGGYKISKEEIVHLNIFWSQEGGLQQTCQQPDLIRSNVESIDEHQNPKFNEEFQKCLKELRQKFETNPDDISKDNFDFNAFYIAFVECMNYGYIDGEDEDYDRSELSQEKLQEFYDSGISLKDVLRSFIIKVPE